MKNNLRLLGYASGMAAHNHDCGLGPGYLEAHPDLFKNLPYEIHWQLFETLDTYQKQTGLAAAGDVTRLCSSLAKAVLQAIHENTPFCVIGGDHSSAIGTWSGVAHAYRAIGDIGLIWIDAHMDSHTPETSSSKNIHGMPVAHLLGYGIKELCNILDNEPKLKPENIAFIGIRSYEQGEAELLKRLGVRVYFMDEVKVRGIATVLQEAVEKVSLNTCGIGISLDLDGIDPKDAPAVDYREPDGIDAKSLLKAFDSMKLSKPLIGVEIAEFNPLRDIDDQTANLIPEIIAKLYD